MNATSLGPSLVTIFSELVNGPSGGPAYMLNSGDPGLLRSLAQLSAAEASVGTQGGASVAAHVEHLRFGLSLMNRWAEGEADPFTDADWAASWRRGTVSDDEWRRLLADLRGEADRWRAALAAPRTLDQAELEAVVGSIAHLAYHLGAVRQIASATRGPKAAG